MWLARPKLLPREFRPDKIGVVFNECCEAGMFPLIEAHESCKGAFRKVNKHMEPVLRKGWGIVVCHVGKPHTIFPPHCETPTERDEWLKQALQRLVERCQITAAAVAGMEAERERRHPDLADDKTVEDGVSVS